MSDVVIRTNRLGKRYILGERLPYGALRDSLSGWVSRLWRRGAGLDQDGAARDGGVGGELWALRDVSLDVRRGEVVGLIGRNGAGKTTLLKILSRITEPTEGQVELHGQVASLLEVGTGFHPELTGRENIYLNGAILGMTKADITKRFDAIVSFAEIEAFVDTPVKRYSSGMYVRLAFAVAAHLEPDILLVDEILAVGDIAFQQKCLGRMERVAKEGRTVLLVSHNLGAIARMCPRVVWLDGGTVRADGPAAEVVARYQAQYLHRNAAWQRPASLLEPAEMAFLSCRTVGADSRPQGVFTAAEPISLEVGYVIKRALSACQITVRVDTGDGVQLFFAGDTDTQDVSAVPRSPGRYRACFTIPPHLLAPGVYAVSLGAHVPARMEYEFVSQVIAFEVSPVGSVKSLDLRGGIVAPRVACETQIESA